MKATPDLSHLTRRNDKTRGMRILLWALTLLAPAVPAESACVSFPDGAYDCSPFCYREPGADYLQCEEDCSRDAQEAENYCEEQNEFSDDEDEDSSSCEEELEFCLSEILFDEANCVLNCITNIEEAVDVD